MTSLKETAAGMRSPIEGRKYYLVALTAGENGTITWSAISEWRGFTDENPPREIRAASLVNVQNSIALLTSLGFPYLVVNSDRELFVFLLLGGYVLVDSTIAEQHIPDVLAPQPCAAVAPAGFRTLKSLPQEQLSRAPAPKQRMRIIKRDGGRCKICGRRPADYMDVELHVHHIRRWSKGGITEDNNLITLCHTCHKAVESEVNFELYELVGCFPQNADEARTELIEGIKRYQRMSREAYTQSKKRE